MILRELTSTPTMDTSKFVLVHMPCQSGKTSLICKLMQKRSFADCDFVVVASNRLNLVEQTQIRLSRPSAIGPAIPGVCRKENFFFQFSHVNLMCGNMYEYRKLVEFCSRPGKDLILFVDEADVAMMSENMLLQVSKLVALPRVREIYLVTATPRKLLELDEGMARFDTSKVDFGDYCGLKDLDIKIMKVKWPKGMTKEIVRNELFAFLNVKYLANSPAGKEGRVRLFLPGMNEIKSHFRFAKELGKNGFDCVVINMGGITHIRAGEEKGVQVDLPKDKQISEILPSLVREGINFAVVGRGCVGRGITFMSPEFIFTNCIIMPYFTKDLDILHQVLGRLCGRCKTWDNYKRQGKIELMIGPLMYRKLKMAELV